MTAEPTEVTLLLLRMGGSRQPEDREWERLLERVYAELRRVAGSLMSRERRGHTLQPTALVHEAFVRLVNQDSVQWSGRAHFLAVAARCMRNVLVDHARARNADKRGGGRHAVTLDDGLFGGDDREFETLLLHDAIDKLASLDERAARVAEMRLFGGMTVKETAHALGVSLRTVDGDWATARLWLSRELQA